MANLFWVLKRLKNNKLVLLQQPNPIKYSFTQIPLTEIQAKNTLEFSDWIQVANVKYNQYYITKDNINYEKLLTRFFEVVKEHYEDIEKVPSKKFTTDVEGESKLVRSSDKLTIKIARRKNKKTGKIRNITGVNEICIDNNTAKLFFKDVKRCRHYPVDGIFQIDIKDESIFKDWNDFMDKEYKKQLERYTKNKDK